MKTALKDEFVMSFTAMKFTNRWLIATFAAGALTITPVSTQASEGVMPAFPKPGPEHAWLQQSVGKWASLTESFEAPGKPPIRSQGSETVEAIGGFWTLTRVTGKLMNQPFTGTMTLGYDTANQKYIATWVDSMTGKMWNYDGSVDPSGKVLTLTSEGECPMSPGKVMQFRETLEMLDRNHKRYTSAMKGDNGEWITTMSSTATRKR
jgi:hypothetical protein